MLETFFSSALLVLQWPAFGYLLVGIFVGGWIGMVPGLGGLLSIILLLPFIYGMDPVAAFALLLGSFSVTSTTDTVASVMLGVSGTSASQATILDGYPLAQKGEAARALGAAFTVSAFGEVPSGLLKAESLMQYE